MFLTLTFFICLFGYLSLASVGHRFIIHQFYVSKLLQLFEYGEKRVKTVNKRIKQKREKVRRISLIKKDNEDDSNEVHDDVDLPPPSPPGSSEESTDEDEGSETDSAFSEDNIDSLVSSVGGVEDGK